MKKGRKPVADKKQPVTIFVQKSIINKTGIENLKNKLNAFIQHHECTNPKQSPQGVC